MAEALWESFPPLNISFIAPLLTKIDVHCKYLKNSVVNNCQQLLLQVLLLLHLRLQFQIMWIFATSIIYNTVFLIILIAPGDLCWGKSCLIDTYIYFWKKNRKYTMDVWYNVSIAQVLKFQITYVEFQLYKAFLSLSTKARRGFQGGTTHHLQLFVMLKVLLQEI